MKLYCGIDLHGNNNVISIIDEKDGVMFEKRMANELPMVRQALKPYQDELVGIVVESTYNWYWLVDGLMDDGYKVHLANPEAIQQYDGLKFSDDKSDARWLAHQSSDHWERLNLGFEPQGSLFCVTGKGQFPGVDSVEKLGEGFAFIFSRGYFEIDCHRFLTDPYFARG